MQIHCRLCWILLSSCDIYMLNSDLLWAIIQHPSGYTVHIVSHTDSTCYMLHTATQISRNCHHRRHRRRRRRAVVINTHQRHIFHRSTLIYMEKFCFGKYCVRRRDKHFHPLYFTECRSVCEGKY